MAKQPSKTASADSSAGPGSTAVSSCPDAVAAAEPVTPKAPEVPTPVIEHAIADDNALDRAALLAVVKSMSEDVPGIIAELEAQARSAAQEQDHAQNALYSRLAIGEFRNGLATILHEIVD